MVKLMEENINEKTEKRTVRLFAASSFLNDLGSDIIYPIWPAFLTQYLKANMSIVGFIDGLGDAIVSISQAVSGYLADKYRKRKIFIWIGYLFGALSRIGYAFSKSWYPVTFFRILDRAGKIRSAPRDAIIADISKDNSRGRNFGLLRSMDNLGAVVGILLCLLLFPILGYKYLFLIAAIPTLIGTSLILFFFKDLKLKTKAFKGYHLKLLSKDLKILLVLSAIFALANFSYSFLMIFASKYGFEIKNLPFLYLVFTLSASIFSLYFGKLSDKVGRKKVLIFALLLWILTLSVIMLFRNWIGFIISFIIYGLHRAAFEPVHKTFISELAPPEHRASILGGFQLVIGLFAFPSSFLAGILWDKIGIFAPFYNSIILTVISIFFLFQIKTN